MRDIVTIIDKVLEVIPEEEQALRTGLSNLRDSHKEAGPHADVMASWNVGTGIIEDRIGKIPMGLGVPKGSGLDYHPAEARYRADLTDWMKKVLNTWLNQERF